MHRIGYISSASESPDDPVECPDECKYYTPDDGPDDYCKYPDGCVYDPDERV